MPFSNTYFLGRLNPNAGAVRQFWIDGTGLPDLSDSGWHAHRAPVPEEDPLEPLPGEEPTPDQEEPPPHPDPSLTACCDTAERIRQGWPRRTPHF